MCNNMRYAAGLLLLVSIQSAIALETDAQQPIEIEADKISLDEASGVARYEGHVQLTQGSIRVSANELILSSRDGRLQQIEIKGDPAQPAVFQQQTLSGQQARAEAEQMNFIVPQSRLILTGHASMAQGTRFIHSERIEYNTETNNLIAGNRNKQSPEERVHIVITPDEK